MKTGWIIKKPDGSLDRDGIFYDLDRYQKPPLLNRDSIRKGFTFVPVVMVEIPDPDADGHCSSDCPFRWESPADPDWMACQLQRGVKDGDDMKPDPARCPAGKGGGGS